MKRYKEVKRTVAVAELKARLSEYLAAVKRGEEVIVTERGRPVARLRGLARDPESRIAELVRAGLLRPPRSKLPADFLSEPLPADPEGNLLRSMRAERAERW
jgi:prevent-host-death family protein